jgi:ABC-2 type transport system ATP-binding protein
VNGYSGGMKRRLDLASALVHRPEVLFLDEPTTGLDPASRITIWDEMRRINEQGTTIFLTTQYLEEADELADRVGILNCGRLVAEGTPTELKRKVGDDLIVARVDGDRDAARRAVANVRGVSVVDLRGDEIAISSSEGAAAISPVAIALNESGVRVREITLRTPTLDDVFLELTGNRIQHDTDTEEAQAA